MPQYLYLVSDGKTITTTTKRPPGLKVSSGNWYECSFHHRLGEAITVYTDEPWVGTLGVYDISRKSQIKKLASDSRKHVLALVARRLESLVKTAFGEQAATEVSTYRYAIDSNSRRNHKWTPLGQLLFNVEEIISGVGFRDE